MLDGNDHERSPPNSAIDRDTISQPNREEKANPSARENAPLA
jgi:hypothetical protein